MRTRKENERTKKHILAFKLKSKIDILTSKLKEHVVINTKDPNIFMVKYVFGTTLKAL